MDQVDRQILLYLQDNARISMTELGKTVGLTQPAVTERVRRLEERGIIKDYRAMVAREKIGKTALAFIWFRASDCSSFHAFCQSAPEIVECHRISGEYNHLLKVVADSLPALELLENELARYGKFATSIALSSPVEYKGIVPAMPEAKNND
ncbi:Lrp/AsnC family transcriptional regulator [Cohnella nanjingensis]|uniref:Lrp/AsnC family transcriptional regulator n=1 Tax=Cohnella nanjingensis TaxID=1387779 RepID=A0A7X0RPZ7_9BACL|nr:Lrp/AsnC family transcriptional regulator [Cohnella nanjingensis]MBB6671577.1 Lrp/AsnC family transcriptional regulator [Cohnella nanjingensis]